MPASTLDRSVVINLRLKSKQRDLIDHAAQTLGKNRSEFLLEAATRAAQEALLDQHLILMTDAQWKKFNAALDAKPKVIPNLRALFAKTTSRKG